MSEQCEYCHEDKNGHVKTLDASGIFYILPNYSYLRMRWFGESVNVCIEYCPMCGRQLRGGEAKE